MKAEETLQFMMDFQSNVFYNRQKCLNHLFCVIGNGYHWIDGELVEDNLDTKELLSRWQLSTNIEHAEPTEHVLRLGSMREDFLKSNDIDSPKWYPLEGSYSYLFNYPDDIKPDWKALIEECKQMLKDDGIDIDTVV